MNEEDLEGLVQAACIAQLDAETEREKTQALADWVRATGALRALREVP